MAPKNPGRFPAARIKKMIQADDEVGKVASATPIIVGKALELFLESLVKACVDETKSRAAAGENESQATAKRVTAHCVKRTIEQTPEFDFCKDVVAAVPDPVEKPAAAAAASGSKKKGNKGKKAKRSKNKDSEEEDDDEEIDYDDEDDDYEEKPAVKKRRVAPESSEQQQPDLVKAEQPSAQLPQEAQSAPMPSAVEEPSTQQGGNDDDEEEYD